MRGILMDTTGERTTIGLLTLENTLDAIHKAVNCETFDVKTVTVGGVEVDLYIDDEGLFKKNPRISVIFEDGLPYIVGNVLMLGHDSDGDSVSLTYEQAISIATRMAIGDLPEGPQLVLVIDGRSGE